MSSGTVEAGFFDNIIGNQASAENISSAAGDFKDMALEAESNSFFQEVMGESSEDESGINIVSDNALSPLSANDILITEDEYLEYSDQINVYVVKKGDSVSQIAEMFKVSVNTVLWANDLKKNSPIKEGDLLLILPISGVEHTVTKGQTLKSIASLYKADVEDIIRFNGLEEGATLEIGEKIIVPGGEIYNESSPAGASSGSSSSYTRTKNIDTPGYFMNPVPAYKRRSQSSHGPGKRGVDLAAPTGTPVVASAGGVVTFAKNGWNGAYGNLVTIQHPNGTKTLYAHLSKILTTAGATVSQGDIIGHVGSTGRSTGPHLHFEVFNAKNPGATTPMSFAKPN